MTDLRKEAEELTNRLRNHEQSYVFRYCMEAAIRRGLEIALEQFNLTEIERLEWYQEIKGNIQARSNTSIIEDKIRALLTAEKGEE